MAVSRSLLLLVLSPLLMASVVAQPSGTGSTEFAGRFEFKASDALKLTADLTLPPGTGPFPVVVLMHGGAGVEDVLEGSDVVDLTGRGYATVVVDSFTGRGFKSAEGTGAGASIRPIERVPDAFAVLRYLQTHPRLAADRVVLFGRSHGGSAAMVAATQWARQRYAPSGPSFVGFIALYPGCNATYPEQLAASAPLRVHVGEKDDLTPPKPCEAAVARMQGMNVDVKLTTYPDAMHVFDHATLARTYSPSWISFGRCDVTLPTVEAPLPIEELKRCASRGVWMGRNQEMTSSFRANRAREIEEMTARK